jgi:hypothetical protein
VYQYPRSYCYYRNSGVLHTKLDVGCRTPLFL